MAARTFIVLLLITATLAPAQNFSGDARKIGLGGIGYSENIAAKMIEEQRPYTSIVLPLGLIQLFRDRRHFDPDDDRFDPVLAMEYAANPLHYVFGRNPGTARGRFVEDAVNGELSRDLNSYRGWAPTSKLEAEGLASPNWGKTIKFYRRDDGAFHGIYVGAGPYISAKTILDIDPALTALLASPTPVSIPNRSFRITDDSVGQLALAVTGGYRGRIPFPAGKSQRDGVYIGANYHYLRGFRLEMAGIGVRFDTDAAGLLTLRPTTAPAQVDRLYSRSGSGLAADVGVAVVYQGVEVGFGVNGIANRIEWKNLVGRSYRLESLIAGGDFIESTTDGRSKHRVELPVEYSGSAAYHRGHWSVVSEVTQGFQGIRYHGGVERRFGALELRGGGRYSLDRWHPSGGLGFNMGSRVSLDVAAYGTTTNIERVMRPALAVSLRFNRPAD